MLPRLALLRADGSRIDAPFLEQELWSPDGKVLTVLLHPGRVKRGLLARQELGPILSQGDGVVLMLDGRPIQRWSVGQVDEHGPIPSKWKISPVRAASRQALVVQLDAPIDGNGAGYLAVADRRGRRLAGQARLKDGETVWTFTPAKPWPDDGSKLLVRGTLEDPAGNRLESRFESAIDSPPRLPADVELQFATAR